MSIIVEQATDFSTNNPKPFPGETRHNYHRRCQAFRQAHRQQTKATRRKPQRRSPTTEAIRWVTDKIFCHVYGEKVGDNVYPSMTKEAFIGFYNERGYGKRLPNYKLQDHFDRLKTYYYFSSPNKTAEYALAMIDIDVLKRKMLGSPEGARKFAAFLRTWFPNLYVEASTGGKGQHAYLLVRKLGHSAEEVKAALKHLEKWLRQQARGFDIEIVEVKGTPPVVKYRDGGFIESITYGSFAKLPREVSRFSEWANTTTLTIEEVLALAEERRQQQLVKDEYEQETSQTQEEVKGTATIPATSGEQINNVINRQFAEYLRTGRPGLCPYDNGDGEADAEGQEGVCLAEKEARVGKAEKVVAGSISGKNISQEELDLMPTWERFYKQARKNKPLHGDRWTVTETDFAQAVVLLRFFTENRNPDGSLPQRRVQELWTALYDAGDFSRPWNHHRWKAIRDWMSEMGWIEWQDHRYQIGTGRGDGRACKWRLHEEFVQQLDWLALHQEEGAASFVDTGVIQRGPGEPLKPLRYWFKQAEEALFWLEAEKAMENLCAA
jgi:hypothetical protein